MTLVLDLSPGKEAALKAVAEAQGLSTEQYIEKVLLHDVEDRANLAADITAAKLDDRPIWEVIVDIMKDVPPEDFADLPRDGASQVDHYIYGLPKRY